MRKLLTSLTTLTAAIAVIALFTACKQLLDDPEDFLSYWASEAFVKDHSIGSAHRPDGAGVPCVGSSAPVDITLSVHNPKGFSFVMPTSSASAGIVEFKELSSQPEAGTDYELQQTGSGTLKLKYNPSLLQKYEQGSGSLNPTITLKATDGRVFKKTYTFGIKSNTPPPKPEIIIAKTNTSPSKYVLCLKFNSTEMTETAAMNSGTVPVHKDITNITINGNSYTLSYKDDNSDFKKPAETSFIERGNVQQLTAALPSASEKWVLYFDTGVKVESSNPQTSYTITLSDKEGVVSDSVTAELKEKFEVKFNADGGNPPPDTQYILKGDKVTKPSPDPKRLGHIFGGWYTDTSYSIQWDFGTNTVTSNMALYAKWTEMTHTVTFSVAGGEGTLKGEYSGQSQMAQTGGVTVSLTNVPHGAQVTFTATPTNPTQYKVGNWICTPSTDFTGTSGSQTAALTVKADTNVTVRFVQLNALNLTKLEIHGKDAKSGSVTLPYTVTQVTQSDITLEFSGHSGISFTVTPPSLNLTPGETKIITINVAASPGNYLAWSKTVSITRSKNNVANLKSFKLNGETKNAPFANEYTVASDTAEVKDFTFDTASTGATANVNPQGSVSIPVGTGRSFTITVKAQDGTQNTVTFTVKRQKYNISYSVAGGHGKIKADSGSEVVNGSKQVEYGENISFTATPDEGWEFDSWTGVSSSSTTATLYNVTAPTTVTVKFKPGTFNLTGGGPDAWKRLKEEAAKTEGAHTIVINGEITATGGDNAGEIKLGRNLTIKGSSSAVLNANGITRIFKLENGKTLILKDITLKNAQVGSTNEGGGVYIDNGGTLIMQGSSTITNCKAGKGGGVYVAGTFKMEGSALVTAESNTDNEVYLESGKTVTVTDTLTNKPAAKIRVADYQKNRVLAVGERAKKENFKLAPDGGNNWRYKKVGNEVKFVTGKLTYTIEKIISVEEHDGLTDAEYYWTMKLDGQNVHSLGRDNAWKPKKKGKTYNINSRQEVLFDYTDYKTVGAYFLIKEKDKSPNPDDLIAEVTKDITYQNDQLEFEGSTISLDQEKTFRLEFHNKDEGEVDVVCRIGWEDE
ncbi:InlB B-repeat-containing protein [Treponema putidum]|uniref:Bacterial repeat domain-containing protein n=1 Tax=Treponema putidum TaxID=221027 RepID=A0ABY5HXD0_9SPIR|nr:InlB B-repeat-containing protein [Treponema putidum]UTY28888.1 hypothetical protein E4N76_07745 [Treponema putidum]